MVLSQQNIWGKYCEPIGLSVILDSRGKIEEHFIKVERVKVGVKTASHIGQDCEWFRLGYAIPTGFICNVLDIVWVKSMGDSITKHWEKCFSKCFKLSRSHN